MRRLAVLIVAVLLVSCGPGQFMGPTITPIPTSTPDPCAASIVQEKIKAMDDLFLSRFADAETLASQTPRVSLSPQIADLQNIRREANNLDVPPCLKDVKQPMLDAMNAGIESLLAFLAQKPDKDVSDLIGIEGEYLAQYKTRRAQALEEHAASIPTP